MDQENFPRQLPSNVSRMESLIKRNLPGDNETSKALRIAVLRIHHSAQKTDWFLGSLGIWVSEYLLDQKWWDYLATAADTLADQLEAQANQLRRSAIDLRRYCSPVGE